MTDRDRLIELKIQFVESFDCGDCIPEESKCKKCLTEKETDYLLANGVIVPPCKVGDIVYTIFEGDIEALKITYAKTEESAEFIYRYYDAKNKFLDMPFSDRSIGKTVFLTKEEAEKHLKEREGKC